MSGIPQLIVRAADVVRYQGELAQPIELGRQEHAEPTALFTVGPPFRSDGHPRLILAPFEATQNLSRHHLRLAVEPDGRVRIKNQSEQPLFVRGQVLAAGATDYFATPLEFRLLDAVVIQVYRPGEEEPPSGFGRTLHSLDRPTLGPMSRAEPSARAVLPALAKEHREQVIAWLQTTLGPLYRAITSARFLDEAARLLVEAVGFDAGMILLERRTGRQVLAKFGSARVGAIPDQEPDDPASVLQAIRESPNPKTHWADPTQLSSPSPLKVLVASPLLNDRQAVIGYLCGLSQGATAPAEADRFQATLIDLIATGVSTGLARQEQEQNLGKYRSFFPPQVADRVVRDDKLLATKDAGRVTVLFCDVRNYSTISEGQNPRAVHRFVTRVLEALSKCIQEEDGLIVDYHGDAVMAMWGAPEEQPSQEHLAVRAALAMLRAWDEEVYPAAVKDLGGPDWANTNLGIGINTGGAIVGNTGSSSRFKYGPLGNAVNVASRVQGLTKYLGCRLLVTRDTYLDLEPSSREYLARRVCKTRMVNLAQPCELFEVVPRGAGSAELFAGSEQALGRLERKEFLQAIHQASTLLERHPSDGPLLFNLQRAVEGLKNPAEFDPVWDPPGK